MTKRYYFCVCVSTAVCIGICAVPTSAADWQMFGRDATRNPVSPEKNPPLDWDVGSFDPETQRWVRSRKNIRWMADLGHEVYASPVVSDGMVWIGANRERMKDRDDKPAAALLRCYHENNGRLLYEYVSPRIKGNSHRDPAWQGLPCSPGIQGNRLWFFTNRCETVCLDLTPLKQGRGQPRVVWKTDLQKLGIYLRPLWMWPGRLCSVSQPYDGRIYVTVPNGVDDGYVNVPAPEAPSLVCLDSDTGEIVWTDNSPGANVLYSEFSSPLVAKIGDRGQVVVAQGDGWLRSFDPASGQLLWKFDINLKTSKDLLGHGTRNYFLATPVLYKERIYIGSGRQGNEGTGLGRLICLDPTKTGDISTELARDQEGNPLPHRRLQAVDPSKGEKAVPNPNSGLVWDYSQKDQNGDGMIDDGETFGRTMSSVAIRNDLLIAADFGGFVHCFDAITGKQHWVYDAFANVYASPLIVDNKVYVADQDGTVSVLSLSKTKKRIAEISMPESVWSSPVFANGVLYLATRSRLYAISGAGNVAHGEKQERRKPGARIPKAAFAPTPNDVVQMMLELAALSTLR